MKTSITSVSEDKHPLVLVRCDRASVFVGFLESRHGAEGRLRNARRIYYWDGAATLSELATRGTSKPEKCKFPAAVPYVELTDIIEVIPVSGEAAASIDAVPVWTEHD